MKRTILSYFFFLWLTNAIGQVSPTTGRVSGITTNFSFNITDGQWNRTIVKHGWLSGLGDYLALKHGGNNTDINTYGLRISDGYGFEFGKNDFDTSFLKISTTGNIGIGTTIPSGKLEILKNANLSTAISIPNSGLIIRADNDGNDASLRFGVDNTNLKAVIQTQQTTTGTKFDLLLNPFNGNVGIGTTNPGTYKLAVNGNIRAKEIKVETGWADYVFKPDYELPTLAEVEQHIKEKGHLINIPSAKAVAKNGIQLGEMNKLLLQKIEELTLYVIDLKKENQAQDLLIQQLLNQN